MTPEDIGDIFQALEDALFAMAIRNMDAHKDWEDREGFMWTQWQAEQIKGLRQYREKCKILTDYHFNLANEAIEEFLQEAYEGSIDDAVDLAARAGHGLIRPGFFGVNSKKMDVLVEEAIKNIDNKRYAVLNRMNSGYVDFLRKADIFAQSGSMTIPQALDTAMKDFLSAGLNCVEYSNGNRVNIASYAEMALRTSSSEVTRQANGDVRNELDEYLVVSNVIGITCPICQKWQGQVLIDDVYSDGKPDGEHQLVSDAKADNFLHPNCRHQLFMYFSGITEVAELPNEVETKERYQAEQKQRYYEREIRKYKRLRDGAVDPANRQKYDARVKEWTARLDDHLGEHDYLRKNQKRLAPGYTGNGKPEAQRMTVHSHYKLTNGERFIYEDEESQIVWPSAEDYREHTKEEYEKLVDYAKEKGFVLVDGSKYRGDYDAIIENMDRAQVVLDTFPEMRKKPIPLSIESVFGNNNDFAEIKDDKIYLNPNAFRSKDRLNEEYKILEEDKFFVKGSDYRSIIVHELGHLYSNMHPEIKFMKIAKQVSGKSSNIKAVNYAYHALSQYAGSVDDGREIISEVFSDFFTGDRRRFTLAYMKNLGIIE